MYVSIWDECKPAIDKWVAEQNAVCDEEEQKQSTAVAIQGNPKRRRLSQPSLAVTPLQQAPPGTPTIISVVSDDDVDADRDNTVS